MKNKLFVIILALIMVLSCAINAFAAVPADEDISPLATSRVTFYIDRVSGTTANVDVTVHFSSEADDYSVTVYLQKMVNGDWEGDVTNDEYVFYNNGYNSSAVLFSHKYTKLVYGTTYRLMVVSRDRQGSKQYLSTTYSNTF